MNPLKSYKSILSSLTDWTDYLLSESHLPGPRGNLELAQAAAEIGSADQFYTLLEWTAENAPENTPHCFLAFCGTLGLGKLIINGDMASLSTLQRQANDPRWRIREASAMALQNIGDSNLPYLLKIAESWSQGTWLEQRAVVAAVAEPRLLKDNTFALQAVKLLDEITNHLADTPASKDETRRILRQALGYGWSVVIVQSPDAGVQAFEKWAKHKGPDMVWMIKENLTKKRLKKLGEDWAKRILLLD